MTDRPVPGRIASVRVLVVEDERKLAGVLEKWLSEEGVLTDTTHRGEDAIWMAASSSYDVIVLDLTLPGIDGLETCRRMRTGGINTPVLMLTARDTVDARIAGLDVGADDYLTKPFDLGELGARLRALGRRVPNEAELVLEVGDLRLDPATHCVQRGETEIRLSSQELQLLKVFMTYPGELLTRQRLLDAAWEDGREERSNVINVYIRYLREKIDRPFGIETIETIRGIGYRLKPS
jgi:two-component system OmpR family response regulator